MVLVAWILWMVLCLIFIDAIPVKTMAECLAEEYNPNFDGWNDSDDAEGSDYWYDSDDSDEMDAFCRNPDPWGNGFQGHPHFQEDYDIAFLERHGYY